MIDKEKLKIMLEEYKGILNLDTINYLNQMIELEFSVLKGNLDEKRKLQELLIYREAFIYNIINRSLNLLKRESPNLESFYDENHQSFIISLNDTYLFCFCYMGLFKDNSFNLGNKYIKLYQYIESLEKRERAILELESDVKAIKSLGKISSRDKERLEFLNLNIQRLRSRLSLDDKEKIKISNQCLRILLADYGLKEEDFSKIPISGLDAITEEEYQTESPNLNIKIKKKYL